MTGKRKVVVQQMTIADAVSEAYEELQELGVELRSWYDNMPEGPRKGDKGEQVDEAARPFEDMNEPKVPEDLGKIEVTYARPASVRRKSRQIRCTEAVDLLTQVIGELDALPEQEQSAEAEELQAALQEIVDAADAVEFPQMFG